MGSPFRRKSSTGTTEDTPLLWRSSDLAPVSPRRASSVFSGSIASGLNGTFESEVNIDTLLIMHSGTTSLIPSEPTTKTSQLGEYATMLLIVSQMVGSGIFTGPAIVLGQCNNSPLLVLLIWALAAVISYTSLLVYLELGAYLPVSGAPKSFLDFVYPLPKYYWSLIYGVFAITQCCSTNALVFAKHARNVVGYTSDEWKTRQLAAQLIVGALLIHTSRKFGLKIQNCTLSIKAVTLVIVVITSITLMILPSTITGVNKRNIELYSLRDDIKSIPKNAILSSKTTLGTSFLQALFSFHGWGAAHIIQNDIHKPIPTIKATAPISFLSVTLFYLVMLISLFVLITPDLVDTIPRLSSDLSYKIFSLLASVCTSTNLLSSIFVNSRLFQEIAREGLFPFGKVFSRNFAVVGLVPLSSSILFAAISIAMIYSPISFDLTNIYSGCIFMGLLCFGVLKLRYHFRAIKAPIIAPNWALWTSLVGSGIAVILPLIEIPGKRFHTAVFYTSIIAAVGSIYWLLVVKVYPYLTGKSITRSVELMNDGTKVKLLEYE